VKLGKRVRVDMRTVGSMYDELPTANIRPPKLNTNTRKK
jgi:hypothetical protein